MSGPDRETAALVDVKIIGEVIDELRELAELHAAGVLTEAEFEAAKARLADG